MEDSLVDNEEEYLEHDSLSSVSASKDSLVDEPHNEETNEKHIENIRRGSYTLETSPEMSESIRNQHLLQPIYIDTDNHQASYKEQKSSEIFIKAKKSNKDNMSQSMYDRLWLHSGRNSILPSTNNKVREEKIRLSKEEHQKKQKQKIASLNENEKISQNVKKRKELELQRKIEENKKKTLERQRIVDERKERLNKAEEARRKDILKKLVNHNGKKPSPQFSNGLMTMSCFGGFGNARNKPGNKEVVHNRFINTRPVSSTGKVIGFGSSTPRSICENTIKIHIENKKIPEAILLKCEILSRPVSARVPDKIMNSVISTQISNTSFIKPKRQSSFKEKKSTKEVPKSLTMTMSMIDFPSKTKPKIHSNNILTTKSDNTIKEEMSMSTLQPKKLTNERKPVIVTETRSPSVLSNTIQKSDESGHYKTTIQSKSGTFPRHIRKTKVDSHLDSDSIEEEVYIKRKEKRSLQSMMPEQISDSQKTDIQIKTNIHEKPSIVTTDLNSQTIRAPPTKDLSEIDYKARIMENRRIAREKREKEREQLMKSERDKRHADEIAAREIMEIERENTLSVEETHLVTSNDDTLDVPNEIHEENENEVEDEETHLSEITETPSITQNESAQLLNKIEDEKNERKKRLESIMSRVRKPNDESSSDGGVSPRQAMSPEPAELEPEINNMVSTPAFRSTLLQSMMNKGGRLSKVQSQSKNDNGELGNCQESFNVSSPVNQLEIENSESQAKTEITPLLVLIEDDNFNDTITTVADTVEREDCDGKEDSLSLNDHVGENDCKNINGVYPQSNKVNTSSLSSTETEEDNVKMPFEIDSIYNVSNHNPIIQEACVFQN